MVCTWSWHWSFFLIHRMSWTHWVSDSDYIGMVLCLQNHWIPCYQLLWTTLFSLIEGQMLFKTDRLWKPMLLRDESWWCLGWLCDFSECFMPWNWRWKEKRVVFGSYSWSLSFVVVNAWCNSSSRSKWMYYIEGTKMVLVCHCGSSKPEKMYLE